ncbi:methyltransferase domain-containing protein [Nocardiopsis trehalosi]|uniref:methyltransferase domain-containing protein n=1 Tax=Nocardiopsis trehalosi TaxID=109329 RepID=UPI00082E854E|nr:methyltransferase domain-containing protein [Nocardiopsis trehalosi]
MAPDTSHPADPTVPPLAALLDMVDARPDTAALRARGHDLLAAGPGDLVVDAGCGPGTAARELTDRGVRVIGVDTDEDMLAVARARAPRAEFRAGDAARLPLPDGTAAGYRAERLLHALADPAAAVAEARRVLAPGGTAVLVGQDWDLTAMDAADRDLTLRVLRAHAESTAAPWAARASRRLLLDAGFTDVRVEAHSTVFTEPELLPVATGAAAAARATGAVTDAEAAAWTAEQQERARTGRFLTVVTFLLTVGRAPGGGGSGAAARG